jgi:small subunit ribosomal protein S17
MVRSNRKVRVGRVISNKMDQSVVVAIEWRQQHPIYKKSVKRITKLHAHDSDNKCQIGDLVSLMETRPLSKMKRWRVTNIINTDHIQIIAPEQIENLEEPAENREESSEAPAEAEETN